MENKAQYRISMFFMMALVGSLMAVSHAGAMVTAQSMSGTVEVLLSGKQDWKPLTATTQLQTGDQLRTGPNSSIELWFEDGSVLNLAEDTQITISQLEISTTRKTRIARFKLWWGTAMAKVTKLAFTENVYEIETDIVVAGVKFSAMTVSHPQNTFEYKVRGTEGLIEARPIGPGIVDFEAFLTDQKRVSFSLVDAVGAVVAMGVYPILDKISIESNVPLSDMQVLGGANQALKFENSATAALLNITWQGINAALAKASIATFGIPPEAPELMMLMTDQAKFSVAFQPPVAPCGDGGLSTYLTEGTLSMNGTSMRVGFPECTLPVEPQRTGRGVKEGEEAKTLAQEGKKETREIREGEPGIPPAPESNVPQGRDPLQVVATATPTPTPTWRPTMTPTPTSTPTPTPTPTPTYPQPAPTKTPASPGGIVPR